MPIQILPDPLTQLRPVTKEIVASYTRPGDTTTYASGDVICNSTSSPVVLTFANMVQSVGLGGVIQNARMIFAAAPTLKLDADLYLFDTSPTIQNVNAAWAPSTSDLGNLVGVISFFSSTFKSGSSNGIMDIQNLGLAFQCASGSTSLFGILVARNAYVPANGEVFKIRLAVIQD